MSSRTAFSVEKNKAGKEQGMMLFCPVTVREDLCQKVAFRQRAKNVVADHGTPLVRAFTVEEATEPKTEMTT